MPDKKLTDNEIVKALECCSVQGHFVCDDCPAWVDSHCIGTHKQTLDLINRLEARIGIYETCNARKDEAIKHLEAENERLKKGWKADVILTANAKTEAYNEFAEWLYSLFPTQNSEIVVISRTGIAKKVNELVGEDK